MKRLAGVVLGIALLGGAAYWFSSWATHTCQPLDRLFGHSGCTGTIEIADFSPLLRDTMVVTGEDEMASLFGWTLDGEGNRAAPAMVRLDPQNGREADRVTLDMDERFDHVVFSADGQQALLSCSTGRDCAPGGAAAAIVSTIDGRQLSLVDEWEPFPRTFPGDPLPPAGFSPLAMLVANGEAVVDEDDDGNIVMTRLDTGSTIELVQRQDRRDTYAPRLALSADQSRIAMTSTTSGQRTLGDRFWVWTADGTDVTSMSLPPEYEIASNAAWSHDGRALYIARKDRGKLLIDRFAIP